MDQRFAKWIDRLSRTVFHGVDTRSSHLTKQKFILFLSLPFFFAPAVITGYLVTTLGESLSAKAVVFLRSREVKPAIPERVIAFQNRRKPASHSLVARAASESDFEPQTKP